MLSFWAKQATPRLRRQTLSLEKLSKMNSTELHLSSLTYYLLRSDTLVLSFTHCRATQLPIVSASCSHSARMYKTITLERGLLGPGLQHRGGVRQSSRRPAHLHQNRLQQGERTSSGDKSPAEILVQDLSYSNKASVFTWEMRLRPNYHQRA